MPEIAFTRTGANATHLSRAHAPGWAVEVWRDESSHPIVLRRHSHDHSTHTAIYMTPSQARAVAAELLHASNVLEGAQ